MGARPVKDHQMIERYNLIEQIRVRYKLGYILNKVNCTYYQWRQYRKGELKESMQQIITDRLKQTLNG